MRRVWSTSTRAGALLALACTAALFAVAVPGLAADLVPLFLLAAVLIVGMFPGERVIERLLERRSERRLPRPTNAPLRLRDPLVRRTGRAVAFALAVRPPPAIGALPA